MAKISNNNSTLTEEADTSEVFTSDDDDYELSTFAVTSEEEIFSSDDTDFYVPTPPKNRRKSAPNPRRSMKETNALNSKKTQKSSIITNIKVKIIFIFF